MRDSKGRFKKGHRFSKSIRLQMGLSRTGPLNHMWGKVTPEKTKNKMRKKLTGRKLSEKHKQKLRDNALVNPNYSMRGKTMSLTARAKISSAFTPLRRNQTGIRLRKYSLGNHHLKNFLKKMPRAEKVTWLRKQGEKISLNIKNNVKLLEKKRKFMIGNTLVSDYLKAHPKHVIPDWSRYTPHLTVPTFVQIPSFKMTPIQSTNYFCSGITPRGLL